MNEPMVTYFADEYTLARLKELEGEIDRLRERIEQLEYMEARSAAEAKVELERANAAAAGPWQDLDEDCYPEDETDVLWLEKFNNGRGPKRRVTVSRMSRRCGVYGPSHAIAFAEIKMPKERGV